MKTLSFIMVVMLFTTPYLTLAQQTSDAAQAIFDARRDATLANTQIWGTVGCLLGVTGMLIAYVVTPIKNPFNGQFILFCIENKVLFSHNGGLSISIF